MRFAHFSRNGEIRPMSEAVVPLSSIEYQYGFGVYETIRVENGIPLFLNEHLERLSESARTIGLEHPFGDTVHASVEKLIETIEKGTYNLKILLVGGRDPSLFIVPLNPLFPDKALYRDGARFITYRYERPFPRAKTLNMLQSYLAYKKAREAGCYDALLVNSRGCITEGTRTNFLCIEGRTLVSPPESEILLGVARKMVLQVARKLGFSLEERNIPLEDITRYDGAFVTSTSSKIMPVRAIDGRELGRPPALDELMRAYDDFLASCKESLGQT